MYRPILLSLLSACAALPMAASAEALKPAWDALPPETVAAVRLPDGSAYFDAIKNTQIGRHLLSEERIAEFWEMLARELGEDWTELQETLSKVGLEPNDFPGILSGETGAALVFAGADRPDEMKSFVLFWVEPGEELAPKVMQAFLETLDEQDGEHTVARVDFPLLGREVVNLAFPQTRVNSEGETLVTHNAHLLLTREGGRISAATTLMSGPAPEEAPSVEDEPSEAMLGIFARFLQAQTSGEGGFSRDLLGAPGMHAALPEGITGMEFAFDSPQLFAAVLAEVDDAEFRAMLEALGVLDLGKIAFRGTMDRTVARWGGLVSAASPRRGLLGTFADQRELSPAPAAWVPAHVLDYSHFSLNFGEVFARIRDIVIEIGGAEAEQGLNMAEMQVQGMLQTDIASFLSSFGQQHTVVTFPSSSASAVDEADPSRVAMVWSLEDRELWQRVMQSIGMFAPMMGEMLHQSEEQGFSGWRMENEMFEGGLFLGQDHLVLGMGRGTLEEVFSALRNPPEGEDSLLGSAKYAEARRLLDVRPGLYVDVQDMGRQAADGARILREFLEAEGDGADFVSQETISQLAAMLDPDVLREALGMAANQIFTTGDGIVFEGASDLGSVE